MLECAAAFTGCVMSDVLSKEVVPRFLTHGSKHPFNKRTELTRGAAGELLNTEITEFPYKNVFMDYFHDAQKDLP